MKRHRVVRTEEIQTAEAMLGERSRLAGLGLGVQFSRAAVDRETFEKFLTFRMDLWREEYADVDPRVEPIVNTLLMHFFLVGVLCGRLAEGGEE